MKVQQSAGEHVGGSDGEFEGAARHTCGPCAVIGQIQYSLAQFASDDAGGLGPEAHFGLRPEGVEVGSPHLRVHATKLACEVFDHAVGVGMIDVEAVQFAISG